MLKAPYKAYANVLGTLTVAATLRAALLTGNERMVYVALVFHSQQHLLIITRHRVVKVGGIRDQEEQQIATVKL